MLHKQHGKVWLMVCHDNQYFNVSSIFWNIPIVNSKDEVDFAMLFTLRESRRTSDPVLSKLAVIDYSVTIDALALKPSDFCNDRVKILLHRHSGETI